MAILISLDSKSANIRPIRYESPKESWLIAEVVLKSDDFNTKSIGSYINKFEVLDLISKIDKLIKNHIQYQSNFIEPNLEIEMKHERDDNYQVSIMFAPILNYIDGTGNVKSNELFEMKVNSNSLKKFKLDLKEELVNINK